MFHRVIIIEIMTIYPTQAYDMLSVSEKQTVDEYVEYIVAEQRHLHEPICNALNKPIPNEWILKSHRVLERPIVRAAIAEKVNIASFNEDTSPDKVIREYITIATSDIGDFIEQDPYGNLTAKELNKLTPWKRKAIRTFETKPTPLGVSCKITLHDKLPALRALSEMMGLVQPDRPPVLQEYAAPKKIKSENAEAPEVEYQRLLENVG